MIVTFQASRSVCGVTYRTTSPATRILSLRTIRTSQRQHLTMTTPTTSTASSPKKLRLLMLHGFTQSGPNFDLKTKALQKALIKHFPAAPKPGFLPEYPGGVEFIFPTGPVQLAASDIPGYDVSGREGGDADGDDAAAKAAKAVDAYGWWRRRGEGEPWEYEGLERALDELAELLRKDGPFAGVVGFSQGATMASILAGMLEVERPAAFTAAEAKGSMKFPESFLKEPGSAELIHAPFQFGVLYSGFAASAHPLYQAFYTPRLATPMCHFIGSVDTVVSEERSLQLVEVCAGGKGGEGGGVPRLVYHPGGHFVPSANKQCTAALVAFIREAVQGAVGGGKKAVSVEDMDLPF